MGGLILTSYHLVILLAIQFLPVTQLLPAVLHLLAILPTWEASRMVVVEEEGKVSSGKVSSTEDTENSVLVPPTVKAGADKEGFVLAIEPDL